MASEKPPWFKLDPAKFFSDAQVDAMTTLELGACFRLLGRQWIDGSIPDDLHVLARLCRLDESTMAEAWVTLSSFFPVVEPGKRANRFMWIQREKVVADLERRSDEGTRAARKRWDAQKQRNAAPNSAPIASPNGSPIPEPMQDKNRTEQSRPDAIGMPVACERQGQKTKTPDRSQEFNSTEVAQAICVANGWSGQQMIWALQEAIDFQSAQMPEASLEQVGKWLVNAYFDRRASKGDFAGGPQKFFQQALYRPASGHHGNSKGAVSNDDLVARTVAQLEAK